MHPIVASTIVDATDLSPLMLFSITHNEDVHLLVVARGNMQLLYPLPGK